MDPAGVAEMRERHGPIAPVRSDITIGGDRQRGPVRDQEPATRHAISQIKDGNPGHK
jgi:hypothetical protein